ncbi:MAG: CocE/NonD family hydrolase [Ancalomicrobiaceae bacterium]|nr:CocE/NonD family hydrolase [Ancalomicrobiaceae bacterium]
MSDTCCIATSSEPASDYMRSGETGDIRCDTNVEVVMRDGARLYVDVYRPEAAGAYPVLLAFAIHSKEIQGTELPKDFPSQPSWSPLWVGHMEAGDTRFFVSRGYIHVIGSPRGIGLSDTAGSRHFDGYDLIEWIAAQAWCDGNVGMIGIGAFATEQFHAAKLAPPHLKCVFPYDPRGALGYMGSFREDNPGGVMHAFRYLQDHFTNFHTVRAQATDLDPATDALWREAIANPDYRMYPHILNVLQQKGQHMPRYFATIIDPFEQPGAVEAAERTLDAIVVPAHTGSGWYAYTYKTHILGAINYFTRIDVPKRLTITGPGHLDRPLRALRSEMLRWYDHWLKGIDSGALDGPPVRYWLMGANEWRGADAWPVPATVWTKFYLNSWERLTTTPFVAGSNDDFQPPDAFLQMPPTQTRRVERLRYMTDPLPRDVHVAGPISLTIHAAIDQDDTNWIVVLKDVGPDPSVRTAREGERDLATDLPERELTRGWLKASMRALDPARSKPGQPWHRLTREARQPVTPGEIVEYTIEILPTANLFRAGHRIAIDITCLDLPTGVSGTTNVEYIPYQICSSKTVQHKIYHDPVHPSHLLLPIIPGE